MLKKLVLPAVLLAALMIACSAFADQDGKSCWCNVDQYGCWNTGDDGGKSYIMFWSEEARQSIMGTGSAPYKLVVEKPGSSDILSMKCGVPAPVVVSPAVTSAAAQQEPAYDCENYSDSKCSQNCFDIDNKPCRDSCYKLPSEEQNECINNQCANLFIDCLKQCQVQSDYCNSK